MREKIQRFWSTRRSNTRQLRKQREYLTARLEMAARKLADHEIMSRDLIGVQRLGNAYVSAPEVIHPYRRVNEYH